MTKNISCQKRRAHNQKHFKRWEKMLAEESSTVRTWTILHIRPTMYSSAILKTSRRASTRAPVVRLGLITNSRQMLLHSLITIVRAVGPHINRNLYVCLCVSSAKGAAMDLCFKFWIARPLGLDSPYKSIQFKASLGAIKTSTEMQGRSCQTIPFKTDWYWRFFMRSEIRSRGWMNSCWFFLQHGWMNHSQLQKMLKKESIMMISLNDVRFRFLARHSSFR